MKVDPQSVCEELVGKGGRPEKLKNLRAIHSLCQDHFDTGGKDFSVLAIGKLCEARGLLKARSLYNAASQDYQTLLTAWQTFAGPIPPKPAAPDSEEKFLLRIEDPAIRTIVQTRFIERQRYKNELDTLKAATTFVVDMRPRAGTSAVEKSAAELNASERAALRTAISRTLFEAQGWREEPFGEVVNEHGRTIYPPGYASAIRKVLGTEQ